MNAKFGFQRNPRMERLAQRSWNLSKQHKRDLLVDNAEFLVYHWSGKSEAFTAATGEAARSAINTGDHNCRVDIGKPFPFADEMPSKTLGWEMTAANWARDYAFFLDHSPAEVYPGERVVGEFHWQLEEARLFRYPDEVRQEGFKARELGAGGISFAHTCPDLSIGITLGWGGILDKIRRNKAKFSAVGNTQSADYLAASEVVCLAIMRYIESHALVAQAKAEACTDLQDLHNYQVVAESCRAIVSEPPQTFLQAVQWIQFFQVAERMNGHGNGYGRLDLYLIDLYRSDLAQGLITPELARDYIGELYLKYGGNYFSFGGRLRDGSDATNEVSWIGVQAYDMLGGYNQLGVMWHPDIDPDFWNYACDVVGRHGCGAPTLVNYDLLRLSELRSGYSEEDAWNISYSGCQWYCSVGKEYCDHDLNSLVLVQPLQRAMDRAIELGTTTFDDFFALFRDETDRTANALVAFKNATYLWQPKVWPEMVTSLCMHGPLDVGRDVTDIRAVNNCYTSVNVLGVPNVSDSLVVIDRLVFQKRALSMSELKAAVESDWQGQEILRQRCLSQPKFGNDDTLADSMAVRVADMLLEILEEKRNIKGFHFRPSLFQFMGHTYAGPMMGATPDGRRKAEPLAHGMNPMHGRNTQGMAATVSSFTKIGFERFQGGSFQIELEPSFFVPGQPRGHLVQPFAQAFFQKGGVQINLNVISLATLQDAILHPENPEYQDIVVKVTGYSAHFVQMDRAFQEEFVQRVNYPGM